MIDPAKAEEALDFLWDNANDGDLEQVYREAREAEHMLKYEEALLIKGMENTGIPVTLKTAYARADDRWQSRATTDAKKYAALKVVEAKRDAARTRIMLHMSQVKDRM